MIIVVVFFLIYGVEVYFKVRTAGKTEKPFGMHSSMYITIGTYTHTYAWARTHTHTHTHARARARTHARTHTHAHAHHNTQQHNTNESLTLCCCVAAGCGVSLMSAEALSTTPCFAPVQSTPACRSVILHRSDRFAGGSTFGIHSYKTLDTVQPCHLLCPN